MEYTLIAVGLGKSADLTVLRRLTENVIFFEDAKEGDFQKFISWVTASADSPNEGAEVSGLPEP